MFGRRRCHRPIPDALQESFEAFRLTLATVEDAKRALAGAAPGGRAPGTPLADGLAGFDEGLRQARDSMTAWRRVELEREWLTSLDALQESLQRAEKLRLGVAPGGYEQLYGTLSDIMAPLEAFGAALARFRQLGL